jgi:hypothetical protein
MIERPSDKAASTLAAPVPSFPGLDASGAAPAREPVSRNERSAPGSVGA